MRVFYDLDQLPVFRNAVLTIGSFDGMHKGHQQILEQVNRIAKETEGESVVITFHPHPRQVIYPKDDSLQLISTTDEKIARLEQYGADNVVVVPFTIEFSQQSADEYIEKFLVEKFDPRVIVIGYDHRFGLNRQGDIHYLRWFGEKANFEVVEIPKQEVDNIAVSSTKIRQALNDGQVGRAAQMMGHHFWISGTVVQGDQIGNTIGYPTANVEVPNAQKLIPPDGIYAVWVQHKDQRYRGMLYIGNRPTIPGSKRRSIEVNIFDFDKNIYGDRLRLELIERTRGDKAFSDLEGLKAQLARDKEDALEVFSRMESSSQSTSPAEVRPSVAIVLLNFNTRALLEQLLPSVLATDYDPKEIIVADNGSSDDSVDFLRRQYPDLRVIEIPQNLGFAGGYNEALRQVEADYYLLLNTDIEVTPDWLDQLMKGVSQYEHVGAAQPKILDFNQRDQFEYAGASGGFIDFLGYPFCRGRIFDTVEQDNGQYDATREIFWASGAAFLIQAKLFHQVGGFDEDYFAHLEEIDLCWRLKRAGYKILVVPTSTVYHMGGGTLKYGSPQKTYLNFRNSLFTLLKNESLSKLLWLLPLRLVLDGLAGMLFLAQGKYAHIRSIVRAHWHFFPKLKYGWKKRRHYDELIAKAGIRSASFNEKGIYPHSIVWKFYLQRKKYFRQLPW
jgi:riboflavin kinase/FMN adenylyltransferase